MFFAFLSNTDCSRIWFVISYPGTFCEWRRNVLPDLKACLPGYISDRNIYCSILNTFCPQNPSKFDPSSSPFSVATIAKWNTYRILHGKCARTVFTHELWRIRNRTSERSERVRFVIQNNECVNTVQSTFHVLLCLLYTYWDCCLARDN